MVPQEWVQCQEKQGGGEESSKTSRRVQETFGQAGPKIPWNSSWSGWASSKETGRVWESPGVGGGVFSGG